MREQAVSSRWSPPLHCSGIGYYWVSWDWEELGCTVGWSLIEAVSNPLGNFSCSLGERVFDPSRLVPNHQGSLSSWDWIGRELYLQCQSIVMSLGVTPEQRWERRAPVLHLWLFTYQAQVLGSHKGRIRCLPPGLLTCSSFITTLASSSCLYHSPSRTWDPASGDSFHCSGLAST